MDRVRRKKLSEIAKENFKPSNIDSLQNRLNDMIQYAVGRHDWYEDQRGKLFQAALAMISFIAAAAAIATSLTKDSYFFLFTFYFGLLILGYAACRIIFLYTEVSEKDHPYRRVADIKSWYYRYSLKNEQITDDMNGIYFSEEKDNILDDVREDFSIFVKNLSGNFFQTEYLYDDIQQLYILYTLQNYRQKNLKKMYVVVRRWVVTSSIFIGISLISLILNPACQVMSYVLLHLKTGS